MQHVSLRAIARAGLLDVTLVVPGRDGRALHELLRRRAHRRTVRLQRRHDLGRAGDEPGAVAGHRRALAQRLEDDHARAVGRLECRRRRLVEPELRVRLVRADDEVVALGGLGEFVVELARRDRARRIVRVVDPDERHVVVELVESGEEAVLTPQRQRLHARSGEERAALVHRVRRLAERHDAPAGAEHLREGEDRLLRAVGRHDLGLGVDGDAEAPVEPACRSLAQFGQPLCERIRRSLGQCVDEGLANHRIGGFVRVALTEVDHLDSGRQEPPPLLLEPRERIHGHLGQDRIDHERNLASVSYTACRFAIGICSSCRCAYAVAPGP